MPSTPPTRLLFLRPDTYGDLCLFEPVLRIVRDAWPQTEVAVLIRESCRDAVPLLNAAGVQWLTTACDPYRQKPGDNPAALDALRETVRAFAPDCVVAACAEQTWLEGAVAALLPGARQVSLGRGMTDPLIRAALAAVLPVDWDALYPQIVPVEPETRQWELNLHLASVLLGWEAPRWWPVVQVPDSARAQAEKIVAEAGLAAGKFVACAAAGTANVPIKHWPADSYGETLAWLEKDRGVCALLIGHASERAHLEAVQQAAWRHGGGPALWLGQDGEMPVVAALLDAAGFYFGNDTGALHLAAALGRPVVSVFGGGTWPRFQPVAARARTVVQELPCFGCGWDCYFADAPCVRTISTASVCRALQEILDNAPGENVVVEADGLETGARQLIDTATPRLRFLREDNADRLHQTIELTTLLKTSEADRHARQGQVEELTALLYASDADREARQSQVQELATLLQTSEADRDARQLQIKELTALLHASDADRDARQDQVEELTALLHASDADREARQGQVEELTTLLHASDADREARQSQVQELTTLLQTSEADRHARFLQIEQLTVWLKASDADRAIQAERIEVLASQLQAKELDLPLRDGLLPEASTGEDHEPANVHPAFSTGSDQP